MSASNTAAKNMPKLNLVLNGMYAIVMTSTSNNHSSRTICELNDFIVSSFSLVYRKPYYQQRIKKVEMASRIKNFEDHSVMCLFTIIKYLLGYNSKNNRHERANE